MVSTYSEAGVDIDASEKATEALIAQIKGVNRKGDGEAIKLDNGFAGLVKLGDGALAMCTDGVGSKLLLAEEMDSIHTVGIDCVAMNTNDLICVGAEPLSFVDYVALDKPDEKLMAKIGILNKQGRFNIHKNEGYKFDEQKISKLTESYYEFYSSKLKDVA